MNPNFILKNGGFTPDNVIVATPNKAYQTLIRAYLRLAFARLSNQLAIYDRLENKEIIL